MKLTQILETIKRAVIPPPPVGIRTIKIKPLRIQHVVEQRIEKNENNKLPSHEIIPNYERVMPDVPLNTLKYFMEQNKIILNKFIFLNLRHAIHENLSEIILFKLGSTEYIGKITRQHFEETLNLLEDNFIATEEYEFVEPLHALRRQHYVNVLIDETKHR